MSAYDPKQTQENTVLQALQRVTSGHGSSHLHPATAKIVILAVTLATEQSVTLAAPARESRSGGEGHEVEEVEDPPISPTRNTASRCDSAAPTHAYAYARTRARA